MIDKTLKYFEEEIVNAPVENAIIITAKGEVWHCAGDLNGIPKKYFSQLGEKLKGAYVTHNHPPGALENDNISAMTTLTILNILNLPDLEE